MTRAANRQRLLGLIVLTSCAGPAPEAPGLAIPPSPWTITHGVHRGQHAPFGTTSAALAPDLDPAQAPNLDPAQAPGWSDSIWYLNSGGVRRELTLSGLAGRSPAGSLAIDGEAATPVVALRRAGNWIELAHLEDGVWAWYRMQLSRGVLTGRMAIGTSSVTPPAAPDSWVGHVSGWSPTILDGALVPRAFDITLAGGVHALLRIDAADGLSPGLWSGRLKVYATEAGGARDEGEEEDLEVLAWDGTALRFVSHAGPEPVTYDATVSGRAISGVVAGSTFSGQRADVLGFGIASRPPAARDAWARSTRRRLAALTMAGAPAPLETEVTVLGTEAPLPDPTAPANGRDDDPGAQPQHYVRVELAIAHRLADPSGGAPAIRASHGWLAVPTTPPPRGGFPALVVLNGHYGSAWQTFDPESGYWYGDGFARRGYVVLAIDVGHRPVAERARLYGDLPDGDDPDNGNRVHPAITFGELDTDWEEDGERTWDAMRAVDVLQSLPGVNPAQIGVAGLSMGGEVATFAAALDPRLATGVSAGFSPDLAVMANYTNHPCWQWQYAEVREYLDASDLLALVAPRPMIVETGVADWTFSMFAAPYSADKQVLRRARAAYAADTGALTHDLHPGGHLFVTGVRPAGVTVPRVTGPAALWSQDWQLDPSTVTEPRTVFDLVRAALTAARGT